MRLHVSIKNCMTYFLHVTHNKYIKKFKKIIKIVRIVVTSGIIDRNLYGVGATLVAMFGQLRTSNMNKAGIITL